MPVRAKTTFRVADGRRFVSKGDLFADDDPIVKDREELFESVDEVVERATAVPGEKRTIKAGGKKKAAKK